MNIKRERHEEVDNFSVRISELMVEPTDRHNGRRRIWRLRKPFKVVIAHAAGVSRIHVPLGFESDLATIPLICQVFLGGRDDYTEESIVHDFLCAHDMPRFWTNAQMRILSTALGRPRWKVLAVFYALQAFGYKSPISNFAGSVKRWLKKLGSLPKPVGKRDKKKSDST